MLSRRILFLLHIFNQVKILTYYSLIILQSITISYCIFIQDEPNYIFFLKYKF